MTATDAAEGWWSAPPGLSWRCPDTDCLVLSPIAAWAQGEVGCDMCGEHDARQCPACEEWFDHVWGDDQIAEATGADTLTPTPDDDEPEGPE